MYLKEKPDLSDAPTVKGEETKMCKQKPLQRKTSSFISETTISSKLHSAHNLVVTTLGENSG
jgi:hypothetical protein